jgi:competence protein ComEA
MARGEEGIAEYTGAQGVIVKLHATNLKKASTWGLWFCASCMMSAALAYAQQPAQQQSHPGLPAGPGRDTLIRVCSTCHSPENVIANGQDRAGWEDTINKMAGFGATGTDDEFTQILDYLVKNFPAGGPVNVNKATSGQLQSGLGLTAAEADAVIAYRKKNGDFKTVDDLKKVPDLDAKKVDAKKDHLAF